MKQEMKVKERIVGTTTCTTIYNPPSAIASILRASENLEKKSLENLLEKSKAASGAATPTRTPSRRADIS
jgi:hypothetical protein